MSIFLLSEYRERIQKVKRKMDEANVEVLLITNPANIHYLTGYDGWSYQVDQMLIVLFDEEEPFWVGREQDMSGVQMTSWLDENNIIGYSDDYRYCSTGHPMDIVCIVLKEIGHSRTTIGVEMNDFSITGKGFYQLKTGLPKATFIDISNLVNEVRMIKSAQEIDCMKKAAKIADKAMKTGIEAIREGVRECDAAASILYEQITGEIGFGGGYPAIKPMLASGEKTSSPHLSWTEQPFQRGEPVTIKLAGNYQHYHAFLARTVFIDSHHPKTKYLEDILLEGLYSALDTMKPGMSCEEIYLNWRKAIEKSGLNKDSTIGYSIGLNFPPLLGEQTASIRLGDNTILMPNMTLYLNPSIKFENYRVELSESVLITEEGFESLTSIPRKLFYKSS